jgi:hypothetical protein
MTLTSRTDFLLLYKETAEKLMQIVVLTDLEPRILRTFGNANRLRRGRYFGQVPRNKCHDFGDDDTSYTHVLTHRLLVMERMVLGA